MSHDSGLLPAHFNPDIMRKPETTFGNVKADVLSEQYPPLRRNFCRVIRASARRE